jgi:hypothetical protein
VSTPELKEEIRERFKGDLRFLEITKKSAAISQLETAILLWFGDGDPVSIHTLAVAANDCFHAMRALKGKPSVLRTWLRSQSKTFQKNAHNAQNFFKHGFKDIKKVAVYSPLYGEMVMLDSVVGCDFIFGATTALMRTFATRFMLEQRDIFSGSFESFTEGIDVDKFAKLDRAECGSQLLPLFEADSARMRFADYDRG